MEASEAVRWGICAAGGGALHGAGGEEARHCSSASLTKFSAALDVLEFGGAGSAKGLSNVSDESDLGLDGVVVLGVNFMEKRPR